MSDVLGNGQALFACAQMGAMRDCSELRNSSYKYGVLPMPMFDETQDDYLTYTMRWELFYIPQNADLDRSSIILEYLNYTSEVYVIYAYWNTCLTHRSADTVNDSNMMYLVRDGLWYDFITFYNHEVPMRDAASSQINNNSKRFSSWWRGNCDTLEKQLKNVIATYGSDKLTD